MAKKFTPVIVLSGFIIVLQVIMSLIGREYYLTQLTMSAYYCLVILGLTVLMGYAGQLSLGHAAFFAMGGYTTAVLTTLNLSPFENTALVQALYKLGLTVTRTNYYGVEITHVSPWVSLVVAVIITATVAFLIGIPILKLRGHYPGLWYHHLPYRSGNTALWRGRRHLGGAGLYGNRASQRMRRHGHAGTELLYRFFSCCRRNNFINEPG